MLNLISEINLRLVKIPTSRSPSDQGAAMKKKKTNKERSKTKEGLNRKLINYSIVAGAALALAHPASADRKSVV